MTENTVPKTEAEFDAALAADIERMSAEPEKTELTTGTYTPEEGTTSKAVESIAVPAASAPPADKTPDQPEVVPAPVGWSDEDRAHFATLPPNVQKTIARRESEREKALGQKSQEFAERARRLEALDKVISPHRQTWELKGVSEDQALGQLLAAAKLLDERPAEALAWLARQRGVDLARLNQPNTAQPTAPGFDKIQQRLERLEGTLTQAEQARVAQRQSALQQTIAAWEAETGKDGQPLRPHYAAVKATMVPLVDRLEKEHPTLSPAEILSKAYEQATWADPNTRQVLLDAEKRSEQARKAAEARHKADKAKQAGSSISVDGGSDGPKKMDLDEAVAAAMAHYS